MRNNIALLVSVLGATFFWLAACTARPPQPSSPTITPIPYKTRTPTPTLEPLRLMNTEGEEAIVDTLCLEIEHTFPQVDDETFPEKFSEMTKDLLTNLGFQVLPAGSACSANLSIKMIGTALSAGYTTGSCYSGAEVTGQMELSLPGGEALKAPFIGAKPNPGALVNCPRNPREAPLDMAWSRALLAGLSRFWGPGVIERAMGAYPSFNPLHIGAKDLLNDIEAIPALLEALEGGDASARLEAVVALGASGPVTDDVVPALIEALEDESFVVRQEAVRALGAIGPANEDVIPELIKALEDDHGFVSSSAVAALGRIGSYSEEVIPALIQALKNDSWIVRSDAATQLAWIGQIREDVILALIEALDDEFDQVRAAAESSLAILTKQNLGADASRWRQWWEAHGK